MKKQAKMICMLLVLLLGAGMIAGCGENKTGTMRELDVFGTDHYFEFTANRDFGYINFMILREGETDFIYPEYDEYMIYYSYVSIGEELGYQAKHVFPVLWKDHKIMISFHITDIGVKAIKIISDSYKDVEYTYYLKNTK